MMSSLRIILRVFLIVGVCLLSGRTSEGQGTKVNKKNVVIKTFDGVELSATLYPNSGGKKDATVILLHDFDTTKGGSSTTQGWNDLAAALQAEGYVVLSFDFRGFGDSKTVDKDIFWSKPHNMNNIRKTSTPSTIDFKSFNSGYWPYLINDIAAVKAYLDRQNDSRDCNTSSTILIGAGDGAALGTMWMAHETKRRRDKALNPLPFTPPVLGDLECKDIAAAIWLSVTPNIGRRSVGALLPGWLAEASKKNKIPVALVFGQRDGKGDQYSRNLEKYINGNSKNKTAVTKPIAETKLTGEKLLEKSLGTEKWIVGAVNKVIEDRGVRERLVRNSTQSRYYYVNPMRNTVPLKLSKAAGQEVGIVDLRMIGLSN